VFGFKRLTAPGWDEATILALSSRAEESTASLFSDRLMFDYSPTGDDQT
jgi:hypothetical protein